MDLFNEHNPHTNLLPYDGIVQYYGIVIPQAKSEHYLNRLLSTIEWKNDEAVIYGKRIITKRKVAWYGDKNFSYTYSGVTKQALLWTQELIELKELTEALSGDKFNSCLLNLYHSGDEGMAWHSDDEKALGKNTTIASMSLGAERKFGFKHKRDKETPNVYVNLEPGSLLIMKGTTQSNWLHRLPPTTKVTRPRINLTFRTIVL